MTATFGSLFTGIGGFDLGLERAGWTCRWQIEIDKYRTKVLERHWPDVERHTDIRTIRDGQLSAVDLVAGGFPCQPFSVAGLNRGEADERNLWPETIRVIRGVRPQLALLENVPGLLAHRYFGTILGDLAEAGYDAEWFCLRASDFGATQRRERLFIVAYARGTPIRAVGRRLRTEPTREGVNLAYAGDGQLQEPERGSKGRDGLATNGTGDVAHTSINLRGAFRDDGRVSLDGASDQDVADADPAPAHRSSLRSNNGQEQPTPGRGGYPLWPPGPDDTDAWARVLAEMPSLEPAVCRVASRIPDRTHRLAALGDAVVPTVTEWIGRRILDARATRED